MKSGSTYAGEKSPSKVNHITVISAMWLAFEALPLFPARWLAGTGRYDEIEWVVPHCPVGLAGLRQMLLAGAASSTPANLKRRGGRAGRLPFPAMAVSVVCNQPFHPA